MTAAKTAGQRRVDEDKSNFRQRLLDALEEDIAEDGYPGTTVADIVRRARTSRRTFYEHFDSRSLLCRTSHRRERRAGQADLGRRRRARALASQVRQAIEAWITAGESRSSLMLSWIRDVPSLGDAARRLQRDAMENFIEMVQALGDTGEFRAAGVGPVSRQRIIMLLGGLQELTAITVEEGGRMSDVTEEAVDASIALLAPRVQPN